MIYLEYKGRPAPIDSLIWAGFAPCGCINSSLSADGGGCEVIATPEQAKRFHADGSKLRESRDLDTYVLHSHADFPWDAFKVRCQHVPAYGRPIAPIPDGYGWAVSDNSRGLRHLVPNRPRDWSKPCPDGLCGCRRKFWQFEESRMYSTVPCLKCSALAVGAA